MIFDLKAQQTIWSNERMDFGYFLKTESAFTETSNCIKD